MCSTKRNSSTVSKSVKRQEGVERKKKEKKKTLHILKSGIYTVGISHFQTNSSIQSSFWSWQRDEKKASLKIDQFPPPSRTNKSTDANAARRQTGGLKALPQRRVLVLLARSLPFSGKPMPEKREARQGEAMRHESRRSEGENTPAAADPVVGEVKVCKVCPFQKKKEKEPFCYIVILAKSLATCTLGGGFI